MHGTNVKISGEWRSGKC